MASRYVLWLKGIFNQNGMRIYQPVLTFIGFIAVQFIQYGLMGSNSLPPFDLRNIYIIIAASRGGAPTGLLAAALSAGALLYQNRANVGDTAVWLAVAVFVLLGLAFGYWKSLRDDEREEYTAEINKLNRKNAELKAVYADTLAAKNAMQEQVFNTQDSYGSVYKIVEYLNLPERPQVVSAAVDALEQALNIRRAAVYSITPGEDDLACLLACSKVSDGIMEYVRLSEYPEIRAAVSGDRLYADNSLSGAISLAYPVYLDGSPAYLITVYDYPGRLLTLAYQNRFMVVCGLIKNALSHASEYEEMVPLAADTL